MGSIFKRRYKDKDGSCKECSTYTIQYYQDGKKIRESTKFTRERDAKRLLKKREGEIAEGKTPGVYFDKVNYDELVQDMLTDYRINGKSTLYTVQKSIEKHLTPYFGGKKAPSITTAMVKKLYRDEAECGRGERYHQQGTCILETYVPSWGSMYSTQGRHGATLPKLAENNTRKGFLEHDQFLELRAALPEHLRGLVTFGYKTGWRLGEITGLTWDRVDRKQGIIRLEAGETKNRDARTVYADSELRAVLHTQLKSQMKHRGCSYVFDLEGHKIKSFTRSWKTACNKVGLEGRIFHDLRRTMAERVGFEPT
jgi:integrase